MLAETPLPVSLDPLEADYSNNLHASQMVHRTLLDVDGQSRLKSSVLDSFSYDPDQAEIRFTVARGQRFGDGSEITPKDIEMTIKRMAARRPEFPVLRHLRGIKEWAASARPLEEPLSGLITEGRTVRLLLDRAVTNPLFRFALPLFGVVKHDCVDLGANRVATGCPTSGYYEVQKSDADSLLFVLKKNINPDAALAPQVRIRYIPSPLSEADLRGMVSGTFVIQTQEYGVVRPEDKHGFKRVEQPNSRFSIFVLNPHMPPFQDAKVRRCFANVVRSHMLSGPASVQNESSLFARIMPGYMSAAELQTAAGPFTASEERRCRAVLQGQTIRWATSPNNNSDAFGRALAQAAAELGMNVQTLPDPGSKLRFEGFVSGRENLLLGGSGFWAFDPVGDVQMLFTRGLHKPLQFTAEDERLQELLRGLEFESDPNTRLRAVNAYIYAQGLFNVYSHSKRVYLVKGKGVSASIPVAITPPAPWQMFHVAGT